LQHLEPCGIVSGIVGAILGTGDPTTSATESGVMSLVGLLIALLLAFLIGGYVAGRLQAAPGPSTASCTRAVPGDSIILAIIGALLGAGLVDNLSGVTLPGLPDDAPQSLGTIFTISGILALLFPFVGGAIGGAWGARTGRRRQ